MAVAVWDTCVQCYSPLSHVNLADSAGVPTSNLTSEPVTQILCPKVRLYTVIAEMRFGRARGDEW